MLKALKNIVRKRLTRGVLDAFRSLRDELELQKRHRAGVRKARRYAHDRGLRLHLGSGFNYKEGWINVDLWVDSADLMLDLREPFPFTDGSVTHIYSEHVFEHLTYPEEANRLLAESLRVLAPDGVIDIGVPDTERAIYDYYVQGSCTTTISAWRSSS